MPNEVHCSNHCKMLTFRSVSRAHDLLEYHGLHHHCLVLGIEGSVLFTFEPGFRLD